MISAVASIVISSRITTACGVLTEGAGKLKEYLLAFTLVCSIIITVFNVKLWFFIKNHYKRIAQQNVLPNKVIKARNIKLAKLVITVCLFFLLGYILPTLIYTFITRAVKLPIVFNWILFILYVANHANNFILFAVADKSFRDEVKTMFAGWFGCKEAGNQQANA